MTRDDHPGRPGGEPPFIPLGRSGLFQLRLPFVHYRVAWPEIIKGALLCVVALAAVPFVMESIGVSQEIAVMMVFFAGLLYLLHVSLGDPAVPGWITPMLPVAMVWLTGGFEPGHDRIHALIALQMLVATLYLTLGLTGWATKLAGIVPRAIRAGILLGAGIAAIYSIVPTPSGSRLDGIEISGITALVVALVCVYSTWFAKARSTNRLAYQLGKYGVLPALALAFAVGLALGEVPLPRLEGGLISFPVAELITGYTVFGIGLPSLGHFVAAAPMALIAYMLAFGDFVLAQSTAKEVGKVRTDETVAYDISRSHLICGLRNLTLSLVSPFVPLGGPLWVGSTITTYERYRQGRAGMRSLFDGIGSFTWALAFAVLFMPVVSLLQPAFPLGMLLTMGITGFACGYTAINMCDTREEQGVVLVTGMLIAFQGAAIGLVGGVVLYVALFGLRGFRASDGVAEQVGGAAPAPAVAASASPSAAAAVALPTTAEQPARELAGVAG